MDINIYAYMYPHRATKDWQEETKKAAAGQIRRDIYVDLGTCTSLLYERLDCYIEFVAVG